MLQCLVISFGKAVILVQPDDADRRKLCFQHLDGIVCRAVVGNDYICPFAGCASDNGGQEFFHQRAAVPV